MLCDEREIQKDHAERSILEIVQRASARNNHWDSETFTDHALAENNYICVISFGPFVCLSTRLPVFCVCACLLVFRPCVCLLVCLLCFLYVCQSVCLLVCISFCMVGLFVCVVDHSVCLFLCWSVCLSVRAIGLLACLVCLVALSVRLLVRRSVCLFGCLALGCCCHCRAKARVIAAQQSVHEPQTSTMTNFNAQWMQCTPQPFVKGKCFCSGGNCLPLTLHTGA